MPSQDSSYLETIPDKVIRIIKDWDENQFFKLFLYGDDSENPIPTDSMPCLIVDPLSTKVVQGPTNKDFITESIKLVLVVNKKEYMDSFDDNTFGWKKKLKLVVEGQDPVTQYYDPTTILGILRTQFTFGNSITNQVHEIKYGEVMGRGGNEELTGECHILLSIDRYVDTPNKQ